MITGRLGLLRVDSNGGIRWFAGKRGEDWEWRDGRGSPDGVGIERRRRQFCRVPTSYYFDLGRFEQGKKGGQREEHGGFIGEALMAITASNYRGK
jgi:hypothetical protein